MKRGVDYIGVSVGAMIFNDRGELLLCKRSNLASNERGCWEIPGGAVEFNETLQMAVQREMREELGIEIELVDQFPAANHILLGEKQHWVATTFLATLTPGAIPKNLEPEKCDAIAWFPLAQLPSPLSEITQLDLLEYKKRHKHTMQ